MNALDFDEQFAQRIRAEPPLESWRMPSWDERDGYYPVGTVLAAADVPIYRPPYPLYSPDGVATARRWIRTLLGLIAPEYRLEWVPMSALHPEPRTQAWEVAWIEKFVDLINRGFDPPPIICDLDSWAMPNGSIRTHALRAVGRKTVLAWVAVHDYEGAHLG